MTARWTLLGLGLLGWLLYTPVAAQDRLFVQGRPPEFKVTRITVGFATVTTNGVTHDATLATLAAKTFVTHLVADVTQAYVCEDTCTTATLSGTVGSAAGGTQYLLSFDADAAAAQFGDAAAELGASLNPATVPTMVGALGSWSTTSTVSFRLTSGTGALATAGATNLNAGAITFYLTTVRMP